MSAEISSRLITVAQAALDEIRAIHIKNQEGVNLEQARMVLTKTSVAILALFHLRQLDSKLIAHAKKWWDAILDMKRELVVIKWAWEKAIEVWLDPRLTETLMWMITAMSKEVQKVLLGRDSVFRYEELSPNQWRQNLLELTGRIAPEYASYGSGFNATRITHEEELTRILEAARWLSGIAVDLWTANGYVARALAEQYNFEKVYGYDVSPDMIREAEKAKWEGEEYQVHDISTGIPHEDGSIDFLVASLWSAWEVHPDILKEVSRVLKKWWKAWLSFYNKDAFAHEAWQPQMNTLEIVYNPLASIVEVPVWNTDTRQFDVFKISALSKNATEIRQEAQKNWLRVIVMQSFPLLISTASPSFFDDEDKTNRAIIRDRALWKAEPFSGYYLNVSVEKVER